MSDVDIGLISVLFILITVYIGMHVGVALSIISFVCVWIIQDEETVMEEVAIAGKMMALAAAESLQTYEFGVIPLFVLMGLFVSVSDIGRDTYDVSLRMAELDLLPAVRQAPQALLIADGTSCRQQIRDGAGRDAVHVATVLRDALSRSSRDT